MPWGPTGGQQTEYNTKKALNDMDTKDFLREKHSLRKPPHAFGSGLVKKSETEKAC